MLIKRLPTSPIGHRENRKSVSLISLILFLGLTLHSLLLSELHASIDQVEAPLQPHVKGRLLVRPFADADPTAITDLINHFDGKVARTFPLLDRLQLWELGPQSSVSEALNRCIKSGLFDLAEPDYLVYSTATPNDPSFTNGDLWHLNNNARRGGARGADINATDGWTIRRDAESIIVAIVDTGARYTHEDLQANMWRNPDEIPGNRIDDDQNGYIDDIHGINSITDNGDPSDDAGHGTHVAGLIGAVGNNGVGVSGVAWKIQLMPLRFLNRFGEGATSDAIQCINYAVANGAKVINMSWGSNAFSGSLNGAISLALQADVVVVAAAGNERRNNDVTPLYPASFNQNNILSVAATTNRDVLAGYSNYGAASVDLAAPGDAILSTWDSSDRSYQTTSGTSMSSPLVAGAAALMRAHFPASSASEIVARIIATTDPLPSLRGRCVSEGRLNLALSLGPDLIAGFTMSPSGGAPPLQVAFEDHSLGEISNWFWDFGDGQSLSGISNPTHTYNRAGNFPVTLRIESTDGFSVSRTQSIPIVANYRVEFDFFNWVTPDISTTIRLDDNDVSAPIPLPFLFPFYARAHDTLFIGSNGVIGFEPDALESGQNQSIPDGAFPNALICPYWDDLDPSRSGSISYGTIGIPPTRKFVVTWDRVPFNTVDVPLTFQAVLEETTQRIVFQYREIQPNSPTGGGSGATIGLENHGGFLSAKYLFNGSRNLRNEQTIAFTPLSSNGMIVGPERDLQAIREPDGITAMSVSEFQLLNTGSELIGWQAATDQDWVLLSKTQGVLGAGQAEAVVARISPTASILPPGSYFANVQFKNLSSGTGSVERRIHLIINGLNASWEISPQTPLAVSGNQGGPFNPTSRIYTLINGGDRLVEWNAQSGADWVSIEPRKGILAAGVRESFSVRFAPIINNLESGVHETQITLSPANVSLAPIRLTSRLVIQGDASALVLLPDEKQTRQISLPHSDNEALFTFQIANEGSQSGSWAADLNREWLELAPANGSLGPGETMSIQVRSTPEIDQLEPAIHDAELTFTDQSNSASTSSVRHLHVDVRPVHPLGLTIRIENGSIVVDLDGPANSRYVIEESDDLVTWKRVSIVQTSNLGKTLYRAESSPDHVSRFLRFIPASSP